jgi:hypothetical protein
VTSVFSHGRRRKTGVDGCLSLGKMSDKDKSLVLAIIDFLDKSIQDGTVKQDDREGLEIASAFKFFV